MMAETVEEIREWHIGRSDLDDTAAFYYVWIGTLIAEIDRLEAQSKRAEAVCDALSVHITWASTDNVKQGLDAWHEVQKAHAEYLAGKKDKDDGEETDG